MDREIGKPTIDDYEVFNMIRKAKKPRSCGVPRDIPRQLVQKFPMELAGPVGKIFRGILRTYQWPRDWSVETAIALKKAKGQPDTESDTRLISLTAFWSKCMEGFIIQWLNEAIGHKIDISQYGALKGSSTANYLIDLVNFILYNQDLKNPQAILGIMYDFSKAFNRQDHNTLITILSDLGTPGWLLKLVMAFLTNRSIILKYKGCQSTEESLPGGGPQGSKLGLYLFIILINAAGLDNAKLCKNIGDIK